MNRDISKILTGLNSAGQTDSFYVNNLAAQSKNAKTFTVNISVLGQNFEKQKRGNSK
jgi:hypothetical protein